MALSPGTVPSSKMDMRQWSLWCRENGLDSQIEAAVDDAIAVHTASTDNTTATELTTAIAAEATARDTAIAAAITAQNLASGTYTPTLTSVANIGASTAYQCQYLRVGATVFVSGKLDIDPTTTLTLTRLGISLPVASNFGAVEDCGGVGNLSGISETASIIGDATNNRAELTYTPVDVTNQACYFTFGYQVI